MVACARKKDNVNENAIIHVLHIIETSFYLENVTLGVVINEMCFKMGTRDFTVFKII